MAFPKSSRFNDKTSCAPPPTAYNIGRLDEANPWIVQTGSRRSTISHETQRKDVSNIPKLRKSEFRPTEAKAPSFMTRPRHTVHNCFTITKDECKSQPHKIYFGASPKKKSKASGEIEPETSPEQADDDSVSSRTFSGLSLQPNGLSSDERDLDSSEDLNFQSEAGELEHEQFEEDQSDIGFSTGAIPKKLSDAVVETTDALNAISIEDNLVFDPQNINLNIHKDVTQEVNDKYDSLSEELSSSLDNDDTIANIVVNTSQANDVNGTSVEEESKNVNIAIEKALNIRADVLCDVSPDIENQIMFLITDQFIDDGYDTHIEMLSLNKDDLIKKYEDKQEVQPKAILKIRRNGTRKSRSARNARRKAVKQKEKMLDERDWSVIERIIRTAIYSLKDEFHNEIFKTTALRIDELMTKLERLLLQTHHNVEKRCEIVTNHLVEELVNIVNKKTDS